MNRLLLGFSESKELFYQLLLWFVDWVYKYGAIAGVFKNFSKNFFSKIVYLAFGDQEIEPWVRNLPQAFWT